MHLEHEFTYRTTTRGPKVVGQGPTGMRHLYEMADGIVEGARLNARSIGAAADWMQIGEDGFLRMDVRLQLLTVEGAIILVCYGGPAEANERLNAAIAAGEATEFDDQLIRTVWTLQSGDPRYRWVNQGIFIGEGRVRPPSNGGMGFEHRVYRAA